jgi:DNA-binding Lrp family transcriptional regulator
MKPNNSNNKKKMLDQIDCQMIELLQKDGRISNTDIAKEIGLSEATVRTRLNRLIQDEFIQIVAVSNPIKLGFKIVGNIRIHVEIKKMDKIIKELKKLKVKGCPPIILPLYIVQKQGSFCPTNPINFVNFLKNQFV